jgi:hypothetical protein
MKKQSKDIIENLKDKLSPKGKVDEESRPVKWICERPNVWRIVWADGPASFPKNQALE